MKDLPKVFANPIDKVLVNNKNFSFDRIKDDVSLEEKIDSLFKNNSNRIYCTITTSKNKANHIIIGKTNNNLVTINEHLIPIREILDIEILEH